jgi:hypothetical protein
MLSFEHGSCFDRLRSALSEDGESEIRCPSIAVFEPRIVVLEIEATLQVI